MLKKENQNYPYVGTYLKRTMVCAGYLVKLLQLLLNLTLGGSVRALGLLKEEKTSI